jgi:uncharacterized protein YaiL (DUF2058 family)
MHNLKALLLNKGLVTKEQVEKAEAKTNPPKPEAENRSFDDFQREKALENLKAMKKADQYNTIRRWVERNRLDKASLVNLDSEKFFIPTKDKQVTWISISKELVLAIQNGSVGVISFMSNHGMQHAVVPRDIAEDVKEVFPDWLKVLNDQNQNS